MLATNGRCQWRVHCLSPIYNSINCQIVCQNQEHIKIVITEFILNKIKLHVYSRKLLNCIPLVKFLLEIHVSIQTAKWIWPTFWASSTFFAHKLHTKKFFSWKKFWNLLKRWVLENDAEIFVRMNFFNFSPKMFLRPFRKFRTKPQ